MCVFIQNITDRQTDRHNFSVALMVIEKLCKAILWNMTSLHGVCFGMQNMQTFVLACEHLVCALCLHVFKERGRQTEGRQLWLLTQHRQHQHIGSETRRRSKFGGYTAPSALWLPIQSHCCHTISMKTHSNRPSVVFWHHAGDVCSRHSCEENKGRGGESHTSCDEDSQCGRKLGTKILDHNFKVF